MNKERIKIIAYWVTTILGPASFVIGGFLHLTHAEQPMSMLSHLGYPQYFVNIIGFWKLAGAIAIVIPGFPRLKEWAYAGFFFLLTSAATSHVFKGDPFFASGSVSSSAQISSPLIFLVLVIASWALRPKNRKLSYEKNNSV